MSRADRALLILTLAVVGIWGCAQGQGPGPSTAERLKALEVKNAKLEEDFRAVASARDQVRRKLAAAEEHQQQLQQQIEELRRLGRERDELRDQLTTRTNERDTLTRQLEQFRDGLKELMGQVETALPHPTESITTNAEVAVPEKS